MVFWYIKYTKKMNYDAKDAVLILITKIVQVFLDL